ncbi:MAG TPA: helix-turn-helix domain-containing protein [Candidatus Binatia bacterium]|nr:helix-turn-helix domain-containing protein [Candidatus Binatia bacterium]
MGRNRLLDAAERLMADRGVHTVSLREITAAAAQRNASSVQYHFGNRSGLIAAIVARHMQRVDTDRNALLDRLEAEGRNGPHDVVETLVLPLMTSLETSSGRCYLRIVDELLEHPASVDLDAALRGLNRSLERAGRLLAHALGDLPSPVRAARRELCTTFLLRALATRARQIDQDARTRLTHDEFAANLIDVLAAGIIAPSTTRVRRPARAVDAS